MGSAFDDDLSEELTKIRTPATAGRQRVTTMNVPYADTPGAKRGWAGALSDLGSTADDAVRAAVDTGTFGLMDRALEATGAEPGAIGKTKEAREQSPFATVAGDVAGGLATMSATPLRAVGAGFSTAAGGGRAGVRGIAGRAAGYGAEGALEGGAQAAGHTYDWGSLPGNVGWGTGIGAIGGAVMGPLTPRSSLAPRSNAAVPTPAELGDATDMLYAIGRSNPGNVYHTGGAVRKAADDIGQELGAGGWHYGNAPNTTATLGMVRRAEREAARTGSDPVFSPGNIEAIRQGFNKSTEGPDIAASGLAKRMLDQFTANPAASGLSSGSVLSAQAAHDIFEKARGNAGANIRSKILRDAEEDVTNKTAATHSGLNFENNMRNRVARILASDGQSFPRAEREALQGLARRGDAWDNVRTVGNMLGGGGGIGTWAAPIGLGVAGGGGAAFASGGDPTSTFFSTVAPILAGRALRSAGNRSMLRAVNEADDLIRSNSPEFARRQALNPGYTQGPGTTAGTLAGRNAVTDAIIRREQEDPRTRITVHPSYGR